MGNKASLSFIVSPPKQTIARQAQSFCINPARQVHNLRTTDCHFSKEFGFVKIDEQWKPELYPWDKDWMQYVPANPDLFMEAQNALGKSDWAVGFCGSSTVPTTTAWSINLNRNATHTANTGLVEKNKAIQFSFMWHRPTATTKPTLWFLPRMDCDNNFFAAYLLMIDTDMKMRVYEYPYDDYTQFITNHNGMYKEVLRHPMVITSDELSSKWHTIQVIPLGNQEVLILSDMLLNGGFLYRSNVERTNIPFNPTGTPAVMSPVGGTSQVEMTPLDLADTGTFKSEVLTKSVSDATYPTLKVYGWSPYETANDGYLDGKDIPAGATGYAGIRYDIYAVSDVPDWVNFNDVTETLIPTTGGPEFKDFKYKVTLTAGTRVDNITATTINAGTSPVINTLVFEYTGSNETYIDEPIDVSEDVMEYTESLSSDIATFKANLKLRNQNGQYNALAVRPINEIAVNIDGTDVAVLYTLNTNYEWWKTPTQGSLELNWECGDGWEYLRNELVAGHPAYDGQLLSQAMTDFMGRIGFDASRVEITATPNLYLPKKRGNDKFQFKPEDGTPAIDFVNKLKEWFASDWECRFKGDGKFLFAPITETLVDTVNTIVPKRIFYPHSSFKTTSDDYVLYKDAKVELLHDEFFNEIWVVGEDTRTRKPIISIYQNLPSQTDPNAPDYVGRRRIMIVPTSCNRADAVTWILRELVKHYGVLRTRMTFNTRYDTLLNAMDFIGIYGCSNLWRIDSINNGATIGTMTSSTINSATPAITGTQIVATTWLVAN